MKGFMKVLAVLEIIFILWCCVSCSEIAYKNKSPNPNYGKHNIIVNMTNWASNRYLSNK